MNFGQRNLHYLIASESEKNCTRVIGQVTGLVKLSQIIFIYYNIVFQVRSRCPLLGTLLSAVLTMVDKIILIGLCRPIQ